MKTRIAKLMLISLIGVLDILLIATQILITTTNFKWSPWYDIENCLGILILTLQLKTIGIVLSILFINFIIKEIRLNVKMVLISILNHIILLFSFSLLNISWLLFNIILIGIIVVSIVLIIKILSNTVSCFSKIIKGNQ